MIGFQARPLGAFAAAVATAIAALIAVADGDAAAGETSGAAPLRTERVVIMVIDGVRYRESLGERGAELWPNVNGPLAAEGILGRAFENRGLTATNPGHAAILCGEYQIIMNDGSMRPYKPTLFEAYRKATGAPAGACWLVSSKRKLAALSHSRAKGWGGELGASVDCGRDGGTKNRDDAATFARALEVLEQEKPTILVVALREPDSRGHGDDWEGYLAASRASDGYIAKMVEAIDALPHARGRTALFVTADHGRHDDGRLDGFVSHGDGCNGCRQLPFYARGPDFRRGFASETKAEQVDIAPTVGRLLGFEMPPTKRGRVLEELFAPASAPAPAPVPAPAPAPKSRRGKLY